MDIVHLSVSAGVIVAKALSILAIIYLPMIFGARWLPKIDTAGMFLIPSAWTLPIFSGVVFGAAMVYYNLDEELYTVDNIFKTDGPWNLSYSTFLFDRANPFNYYLEPVFSHLTFQGADTNVSILVTLAAGSFGLLVLRAVNTWRSFGAWRGILYGFALAVWACYITIFGVCLVLWLLNIMNFWTLALLTLGVHLYRTHSWPLPYHKLMMPVWGDHDHGHGHGHDAHGGGHGGGHGHDAHGGGHGGGHGGHDAHGGGHGGGHGGHDAHGGGHGGGHGHDEEDDMHDAVHPLYPRHH